MAADDIEWDDQKEAANHARRGIAFGDAATVFLDEDLIVRVDREHGREERLVSVGFSRDGRLLTVVTAEPAAGKIRIISAWRATKRERNAYERRSS
ncbi:MAG: BrnT family toxin [Chloroflexota bacterium]